MLPVLSFKHNLIWGDDLSNYLKIELVGRDGSNWCLAGPGYGVEGVTLSPNLQNFYDAQVKTLYVPGPFGEEYAGKRTQRREIVFTVRPFDSDPDTWATIDSAWRWAWDYDEESTLKVTTSDGVRTLKVRLFEEPKAYDDRDPHITADNPVVMTVTATMPYWQGEPDELTWETASASASTSLTVSNPGDVPVWPRWVLTAPGTWVLPDYSWGNEMYSRGDADSQRTIALPELQAGEHVSVDSDPRVQTIVSVNGMPTQNRWKGNDLLYPIAAGKSGSVPLSISGATGGAAAKLIVPRWYSRPWSRPGVRA